LIASEVDLKDICVNRLASVDEDLRRTRRFGRLQLPA
jgi:hypothetical protein